MTRKATDVLISIEKKCDEILSYHKNQDFLIKNMLSRIDNFLKEKTKIDELDKIKPDVVKQNQQIPGLKPGIKLDNSQGNTYRKIIKDESEENNIAESVGLNNEEDLELIPSLIGKRRTSRYVSVSNNSNVPVQQKILYDDGRAVSMAKIELFNTNNELVKSLKTNATGKWTSAIPSGKYIVKISKKETSTRSAINDQIEINVPNSDEPVQLKLYKSEK